MYCNKSSTKECPYSGNRIKNIKKNSLVPDKLRPNFQKTYSLKIQRRGINMKWTDILKAPEWKDDVVRKTMRQAESLDEDLYAMTGTLDEIMQEIEKRTGNKAKILSHSSSQPTIAFNFPISVQLQMDSNNPEQFRVVSWGFLARRL